MAFCLQVPRAFLDQMLAHAQAEFPRECCGILAGHLPGLETVGTESPQVLPAVGVVEKRYPLSNVAPHPDREYLADAHGLFAAVIDMRNWNGEILAVYHSHPTSEAVPSKKDRAENNYPDAIHLIISLLSSSPSIRGWHIDESAFWEAPWEVVD